MTVEECIEKEISIKPTSFTIPLSVDEISSDLKSEFSHMLIITVDNSLIVRTDEPPEAGGVYCILRKEHDDVYSFPSNKKSEEIMNKKLKSIERRIELKEPPNDEECERYGQY
ncbi:MAG: hypothetical protein Q7J54_07290 [Candidatus Woesearchaeota archaeon]|nr:hypothetical protein [Candidatus Woesearchaeota archaeon]